MDLHVYLAIKKIKLKEFSKLLGCNNSYLSSIASGVLTPGKRLAKDIKNATNGMVDLSKKNTETLEEIESYCQKQNIYKYF